MLAPNGQLGFCETKFISTESLALFGLDSLAYVRPIHLNGRCIHVIHAADGTPLSIATDRAVADITIRQYEMEPVSVH